MRFRRILAVALSTILPAAIGAQTIAGTVVRGGDNAGVSGVIVLLLNTADSVVGRSLTNERGEFLVSTIHPGGYRLRTMRIGFLPLTSDVVILADGQRATRRIALTNVPFLLDTARVASASVCSRRADAGDAVFGLWEQVRTALLATQVTALDHEFTATTVRYDRDLEPDGRKVRTQSAALYSDVTTRPWLSPSAETLRRFGFIVADSRGDLTYYAPDLDVLLSDDFLIDHCIRVARGRNPNLVGVGFEPTRARSGVAEIQGTVWLSKRTSELQNLEYRYTNISAEQEAAGAGGTIEFASMKNGGWMISRWDIRMPQLARVSLGDARVVARLTGIKVVGGKLALVQRGRDTLFAGVPLTLAGTVLDSTTGTPAANARVSLRGTFLDTTTDATGRFTMRGVLAGNYDLVIRTASLDSLGAIVQQAISVTDLTPPLTLRAPTALQVASRLCGQGHGALVTGTVRLPDGTVPPGRIVISAKWPKPAMDTGSTFPRTGVTAVMDASGRFRMCDAPLLTAISLSASGDSARGDTTRLQVTNGTFALTDLTVSAFVDRGATLRGVVFTGAARTPIADAEVTLSATLQSARTDARGEFSITGIRAGRYEVFVRRLGYTAFQTTIDFGVNQDVRHEIALAHVQTLDSVRVIARGNQLPGFEDHRKLGLGAFITRDQLANMEGVPMDGIFRDQRAAGIVRVGTHSFLTTHRGIGTGRPPSCDLDQYDLIIIKAPPCKCYARVFLNHSEVYNGAPFAALFDMSSLRPADIEAIEYYASNAVTPMEYQSSNGNCGVVVIWTRLIP